MSSSFTATELWTFARSRRTWLIPTVLVLLLAMSFPLIYLSATASPQDELKNLPIALVTEPQAVVGSPAVSAQLASAVADGIDSDKIALTEMTSDELATAMDEDRVAGAIVIPSDFDASIGALSTAPDAATPIPEVRILTNAGDGGINNGLVTGNLTPVLEGVRAAMGQQFVAALPPSVPGAQALLLSTPFVISDSAYRELPSHSGFGTSALYYALALVLLGFVGASVINPSIDSALGFAPAEMGPLVARRPYRHATRRQTLLVKWTLLTVLAPAAAALVLAVAHLVGVPIPDPVHLWLFGSAAIATIGWGALTVFAIFGGGVGALVNTTFFIALAMTSSGATVPVSATPPFFAWLSWISPFHAVSEGVRALLYFGGNPRAGLLDGWAHMGIGAVVAIALGLAVSALYARRPAFSRHPRPTAQVVSRPA